MKHVYERNVPMKTRDGVTLHADVWRPLEGRAPTLLMRTPYNKEETAFGGGPNNATPSVIAFLNAGYAAVPAERRYLRPLGTDAARCGVDGPAVSQRRLARR